MSDLKRLSDGCRVKADLYARAHPEIPKSFIWIADEIDRILGVAQGSPDHIEIKRLSGLLADAQRIIAEYKAGTIAGARADVAAHGLPGARVHGGAGCGDTMKFFSQNVDAWGALEWFDRLAKAIRQQDGAVVAGNMLEMETCRNVAASSAMRLVRDYEQQVRVALSLSSTHCGGSDV